MSTKIKIGLRERILAAKDENEVTALLKEGEDFEYASGKTRRSWKRTASAALANLKK